ncbi:Dihydropteroate synthase, DHPS [Rhodobacterales bacterium HTCC2150]|nr:Dihydropteroate synthase, DHPS [Rhodobacterales bacterium HTCC2150] [Rhodobacteraceae bacterium HTCC2150]
MSKIYYRPIAQTDAAWSRTALPLAGGWCWFDRLEIMERGRRGERIAVSEAPEEVIEALSSSRTEVAGVSMAKPRLMGILNVTPDSFSDGGKFAEKDAALIHATQMATDGADFLDIGGESTRPGANFVPSEEEMHRVGPVIRALSAGGLATPLSIDTRKSQVADVALKDGAAMLNDVSAGTYDENMFELAKNSRAPLCLMHAQGDPKTMQENPTYDDVVLDVYDFLAARIKAAMEARVNASQLVIDPGLGFGKTQEHNLAIVKGLSLFHGLGCPILMGASRKRFIGTIGQEDAAELRGPGSMAVGLAAIAQGVQITRVHDLKETKQALRLWRAVTG